MNDLLSATAAAEQIRSSEAQALHENELFEKASAEYDQAQAVGGRRPGRASPDGPQRSG